METNKRKKKMVWKGDPETPEKDRYDYRWIKDAKKRKEWIDKYWK